MALEGECSFEISVKILLPRGGKCSEKLPCVVKHPAGLLLLKQQRYLEIQTCMFLKKCASLNMMIHFPDDADDGDDDGDVSTIPPSGQSTST